jgi:hypothetical protein
MSMRAWTEVHDVHGLDAGRLAGRSRELVGDRVRLAPREVRPVEHGEVEIAVVAGVAARVAAEEVHHRHLGGSDRFDGEPELLGVHALQDSGSTVVREARGLSSLRAAEGFGYSTGWSMWRIPEGTTRPSSSTVARRS